MTSDTSSQQGPEPAAVPPSSGRPPAGKPPVAIGPHRVGVDGGVPDLTGVMPISLRG